MNTNVTPVILTATDLVVHFGDQIVLDNASLSVHEGDRIGLVGRNGAGKSTFLKIISNNFSADSGEIAKMKGLKIGFLSQEFTLDETSDVYNNILNGASKIVALLEEYEKTPFDSPQKEILEQKINDLDAWNLDKKIDILIKEIHCPSKSREVKYLSGGEKRRVALARALISNPDLLILDEPTNHLDTESIEWIENYLSGYKGTCMFVTHDRYFLDRIANRIVELENGVFYSNHGNYTEYLINKSERQAQAETVEKKRQNFLRRELDWIVRSPKARTSKSKSRIDKYYEIANQEKFEKELDVELVIPKPERLGNKILELQNIACKINNNILFKELIFNFEKGRRLGIVGKNGVGKTSLLKIILGELEPYIGKVDVGEKTIFNYIDQSRLILNDEDTVIEAVSDKNEFVKFGNQQIKVWSYLKRFLFTDDRINTKVGRLSGGEKSRLTLANILKKGGNFLLLDEPTNDLDLPTLRVLEEALLSFEGCIVVVSHDRYFLNRICNGIFSFEENGQIHFSEGNYDYYASKRKERLKNNEEHTNKIPKRDSRVKPKVRKLTWKEKIELEGIEQKILDTENEVDRIESIFSAPDFYEKYSDQINELNSKLEKAKKKNQELYERWEELEEIKNNS